jgi:hypothetical protein
MKIMDIKDIQEKLKQLRDRIKDEGCISPAAELELKTILNDTLVSANNELSTIQERLSATMAMRAGNDNTLSDDQKKRLRIVEKTGTGSHAVH